MLGSRARVHERLRNDRQTGIDRRRLINIEYEVRVLDEIHPEAQRQTEIENEITLDGRRSMILNSALPVRLPRVEHFGIGDVVLAGALVEEIKEPLDGRRQVFVDGQDGAEEVDDELLDRALGGQEAREEDLGYRLGRTIHLSARRPRLAVALGVVHRRPDEVERLQVDTVLRVGATVAVLEDRVSQRRVEVVRVDT